MIIGVGCSDGSLRLLDWRQKAESALIASVRAHDGPVSHLCMQPLSAGQIVATNSVGEAVKLVDLRMCGAAEGVQELYRSASITAFVGHASQPLVAVGSRRRNVKLFELSAKRHAEVKTHFDLWGSRLGSVSCLAFHPQQQLLAVGATNDHICVCPYETTSWSDSTAAL